MSLKSYVVGALALAAFAVPTGAAAADNPYQVGPDPTVDAIRQNGPLPYQRQAIPDSVTPGFGTAYMYAPTDTSRTYGAVAIAPGWTETTSAIHWLGPRLASHGFVVILFNVNNTFLDLPGSRASQLLRALDYLTLKSPWAGRVDRSRQAVMGHSMGGGGALDASQRRPTLKASVPLMPWNVGTSYPNVTVPTMIMGAQNDIIAPVSSHALPFYNSIPDSTPKGYFEIRSADHFASNAPNPTVGAESIAWLKRFVDNDTRYSQFICPSAIAAIAGKQNRYYTSCPF